MLVLLLGPCVPTPVATFQEGFRLRIVRIKNWRYSSWRNHRIQDAAQRWWQITGTRKLRSSTWSQKGQHALAQPSWSCLLQIDCGESLKLILPSAQNKVQHLLLLLHENIGACVIFWITMLTKMLQKSLHRLRPKGRIWHERVYMRHVFVSLIFVQKRVQPTFFLASELVSMTCDSHEGLMMLSVCVCLCTLSECFVVCQSQSLSFWRILCKCVASGFRAQQDLSPHWFPQIFGGITPIAKACTSSELLQPMLHVLVEEGHMMHFSHHHFIGGPLGWGAQYDPTNYPKPKILIDWLKKEQKIC